LFQGVDGAVQDRDLGQTLVFAQGAAVLQLDLLVLQVHLHPFELILRIRKLLETLGLLRQLFLDPLYFSVLFLALVPELLDLLLGLHNHLLLLLNVLLLQLNLLGQQSLARLFALDLGAQTLLFPRKPRLQLLDLLGIHVLQLELLTLNRLFLKLHLLLLRDQFFLLLLHQRLKLVYLSFKNV